MTRPVSDRMFAQWGHSHREGGGLSREWMRSAGMNCGGYRDERAPSGEQLQCEWPRQQYASGWPCSGTR